MQRESSTRELCAHSLREVDIEEKKRRVGPDVLVLLYMTDQGINNAFNNSNAFVVDPVLHLPFNAFLANAFNIAAGPKHLSWTPANETTRIQD